VFLLGSMFGWSLEPATDPDAGHADDHGPDTHAPDGDEGDNVEIVEEAPVG